MKKNRTGTSNNITRTALKKATALKYDGKNTPKIVAKGDGTIAQQIVSLAQENGVHIHYDPLLLNVLSQLELDEEIPETLFLAVAKIIAFAYYLQGKHLDPDNQNKKNSPNQLSRQLKPIKTGDPL